MSSEGRSGLPNFAPILSPSAFCFSAYCSLFAHCHDFQQLTAILFAMSEQTCAPLPPPTVDNDLLDPYEKLIGIEILGTARGGAGEKPLAALFPVPLAKHNFLWRLLLEWRLY